MLKRIAIAAAVALAASPASAHVGHGSAFAITSGFAHPLSGIDHLAAMTIVGVWAALAGGHRIWVWPLAFVGTMAAGGAAGAAGFSLPAVEPAIAASLVVLGLVTLLAVRAPTGLGAALVSLFALFHGHAHGVEAAGGDFFGFTVGFVAATALLHGAGIVLGGVLQRRAGEWPSRALGAATAGLGLVLLAA